MHIAIDNHTCDITVSAITDAVMAMEYIYSNIIILYYNLC